MPDNLFSIILGSWFLMLGGWFHCVWMYWSYEFGFLQGQYFPLFALNMTSGKSICCMPVLIVILRLLVLTLFLGGQICPPVSYFSIAPKLKKIFALMHPDFKSNLITHIFRKFGVSQTTGSDVIFAFARSTYGVSSSFEHNACLSVCVF